MGALKDATNTQTGQVIANFKFIGSGYKVSNMTFKLGNTAITPTSETSFELYTSFTSPTGNKTDPLNTFYMKKQH